MFWDNYLMLCNEKKMSPNAVARELSVSSGAVTFWKNGKVPHHGTLLKIADYFNVSVDSLLSDKKEKPTDSLVDGQQSEQLERITDALRDLPDEAAAQVLAYAELLKLKYKK